MELIDFVAESNRIEGIVRAPIETELAAHKHFLSEREITISRMILFVHSVAPGKPLRNLPGMDVRVGNHIPPRGGAHVEKELGELLTWVSRNCNPAAAYLAHHDYETLHPFMDGNGRSGRVLWLWMMGGIDRAPLGFLHHFYYQALSHGVGGHHDRAE